MKTFYERPALHSEIADVNCNLCARDINKNMTGYFEDHISLVKHWGYHSPFDGEVHSIDLCVDCYQGLVSQFEIEPQVEYYNFLWE